MYNEDNIVALATPPGTGALAIIRVSGKKLLELTLLLINKKKIIQYLEEKFNGSKSKKEVGEQNQYPTIWSFLWSASGSSSSTYGPTNSQLKSLQNTKTLYREFKNQLFNIDSKISSENENLKKIDAPSVDLN